jgi:hypothetical protein
MMGDLHAITTSRAVSREQSLCRRPAAPRDGDAEHSSTVRRRLHVRSIAKTAKGD